MKYYSESMYTDFDTVSLHRVPAYTVLPHALPPRQQVPYGIAQQLDVTNHPCCYWAMTQGGDR